MELDLDLDLSAFDPIEEMGGDCEPDGAHPDAHLLPTLEYFPRWQDSKPINERELLDSDALSALMKRVHVCNIARRMHEQGLMMEESLKEGFIHLWEAFARKRAAHAISDAYVDHMYEVSRWLAEFKPNVSTIVETGLASVQHAALGTSTAAKASRKIRDWHKVTRYNRTRALERGDSKSFIDALAFVQALLEGYMNTRYWAIIENSRSIEARLFGGNNCKYTPTGMPKSAYRLVIHNQTGETIVSPALKRVQPAGDITPSPKITFKTKRITKASQ